MTARRKTPPVDVVDLGHVRFWLEDLQRIEAIIADQCPDGLELDTESYDITTVSDLKDIPDPRIKALSIKGVNTSVQVTLNPALAEIRVDNPEPRHLGMIQLIKKVANERRRPIRNMLGLLLALSFPLAYPMLFFLLLPYATLGPALVAVLTALLALLVALLIALVTDVPISILGVRGNTSSAILFTRTRAEAPTFWERNKDQIIVNAVFLILGAVLGVITTLAVGP